MLQLYESVISAFLLISACQINSYFCRNFKARERKEVLKVINVICSWLFFHVEHRNYIWFYLIFSFSSLLECQLEGSNLEVQFLWPYLQELTSWWVNYHEIANMTVLPMIPLFFSPDSIAFSIESNISFKFSSLIPSYVSQTEKKIYTSSRRCDVLVVFPSTFSLMVSPELCLFSMLDGTIQYTNIEV